MLIIETRKQKVKNKNKTKEMRTKINMIIISFFLLFSHKIFSDSDTHIQNK